MAILDLVATVPMVTTVRSLPSGAARLTPNQFSVLTSEACTSVSGRCGKKKRMLRTVVVGLVSVTLLKT